MPPAGSGCGHPGVDVLREPVQCVLLALLRGAGRLGVQGSPLAGEYRLHVHDGRPVEGFEIPNAHAESVDRHDAHPVQPDRIRPVLGPRAEHARLGVARVVARVDGQHVAPCLVQSGQHEDVPADDQVAQACCHVGVEHQLRVGRAFKPLLRGGRAVDEGRLDVPDRPDLVKGWHPTAPLCPRPCPCASRAIAPFYLLSPERARIQEPGCELHRRPDVRHHPLVFCDK